MLTSKMKSVGTKPGKLKSRLKSVFSKSLVIKGEGSTAWRMGYDDQRKGVRRNDNPFATRTDPEGKEKFKDWAMGWVQSYKDSNSKSYIAKEGFSGKRRGKDGVTRCYQNGVPIPCPDGDEDEPKDNPSTDDGEVETPIKKEKTTECPTENCYSPDVEEVDPETGVTKASRVGVPAMELPPPPGIHGLPNLTPYEREVEQSFTKAFEDDPDGVAGQYLNLVKGATKEGEAPVFATDDAKALTDAWSTSDKEQRAKNRATLNTPLHQTANAIAKRAFVQHLDTMNEGDEILVTVGGCGAGKGFALKNVPEALELKKSSKVVWDSAGDQNATENPWIMQEAEKRGLKVNFVYVHADPKTQWAHPERGVVKRAQDPNDGRMVGAKVFADSYALGAKNMKAFFESTKDNPNAKFMFLENGAKPKKLDGVPEEALGIDRNELAKFAADVVKNGDAPAHVKRGALMDERIWND